MTQVQTMTNPELNRKLTELLGYKVVQDEVTGMFRMMNPQGKEFGMSRPTEGLVWNEYAFPYCSDEAASRDLQMKVTEEDAEEYVGHLHYILEDKISDSPHWIGKDIAALLNASPRQRAEAAYITLSSERSKQLDL
jgi:hypothetical protein